MILIEVLQKVRFSTEYIVDRLYESRQSGYIERAELATSWQEDSCFREHNLHGWQIGK